MARHTHTWQQAFAVPGFAVIYRCSCSSVVRVLRSGEEFRAEVLSGGLGPFTSDDERQLLMSAAQALAAH